MGPTSVAPDEINAIKNSCDFLILGADGQQGLITSKYLYIKGYKIVCVDLYTDNVKRLFKDRHIPIITTNCTQTVELKRLLEKYRPKVLLNLTYQQSLSIVKLCMEYGVNFLDIFANYDWVDKFGKEGDQNSVYSLNKIYKTVILTGCGCAPGITSLLAKKLSENFKSIETVEAGFCWDSNIAEFVPPFCISDAAYELFYDAQIIVAKQSKGIEPRSYTKEYNFPLIGKKKVYAMSHIELYSFLDYFEKKGIRNVYFYGGFPEHCIKILESLNDLGLIKEKESVLKISDQQGNLHLFTSQDVVTAISKHINVPDNYTETEIVWCTIIGKDIQDREITKTMLCKVPPIKGWEKFGCNVDTGVPAAVIGEMILQNKFLPGVYMPEHVVDADQFIHELENFGFEFTIQHTLHNN